MTRSPFTPATQAALAALAEAKRAIAHAAWEEATTPAGLIRAVALMALSAGLTLTLKRFVEAHGPDVEAFSLAAE